MMRRALILTGVWLLATADASAAKLDSDQLQLVVQAATAMAEANLCNFEVRFEVIGKYLEQKQGGASYDNEQLAQAMFTVIGAQAISGELGGLNSGSTAQIAKFCVGELALFGPNGKVIPGALAP